MMMSSQTSILSSSSGSSSSLSTASTEMLWFVQTRDMTDQLTRFIASFATDPNAFRTELKTLLSKTMMMTEKKNDNKNRKEEGKGGHKRNDNDKEGDGEKNTMRPVLTRLVAEIPKVLDAVPSSTMNESEETRRKKKSGSGALGT